MSFLPDHRVSAVHRRTDGLMALVKVHAAEQGQPVTCRAGCAACCYEPVYADKLEVKNALSSLTQAQVEQVKNRTLAWIHGAQQSELLKQEEPNAFEYRRLRLACPFLEGQMCSVYDHRPISCRMHCAIGPPEHCHDDALRPNQRFVFSQQAGESVMSYAAKNFQRLDMDHLGVMLAEVLFDFHMFSAGRKKVSRNLLKWARKEAVAS